MNGLSEKKQELLEDVKRYTFIFFWALVIFNIFAAVVNYEDCGNIFGNMKGLMIVLLVVSVLLLVVWFVLRGILRKVQGETYVGPLDIFVYLFDYISDAFRPTSKNQGILDRDPRIKKESHLWKAASKGINISYLLASLFCLSFAGGIIWVIIEDWIRHSDDRLVSTTMGSLFVVILLFWGLYCMAGVRRKPDGVLEYVEQQNIDFWTLESDFLTAKKYGRHIYLGSQYVFVVIAAGMQVMRVCDITEYHVTRMGGNSLRRMCLSYYLLTITSGQTTIIKYGIIPVPFYRLTEQLDILTGETDP